MSYKEASGEFRFDRERGYWVDPLTRYQRLKLSLREIPLYTFVLLIAFATLGLDGLLAQTELITPINQVFLWGMALMGVGLGFVVGDSVKVVKRWPKIGLLVNPLIGMLFFCAMFIYAAWRIANWWEFPMSGNNFSTAFHKIEKVHDRTRRSSYRYVEINPYDLAFPPKVHISPQNFATIKQLNLHHKSICIGVNQRRSTTGAIEMKSVRCRFVACPVGNIRPCTVVPNSLP